MSSIINSIEPMNVDIQSIHFDADQKLVDYVNKKAQRLTKFFDRITNVEVFLKLENTSSLNVKNKWVEIKVLLPGNTLFSKEFAPTFEAAADQSFDHMRRQLKRYKEKIRN